MTARRLLVLWLSAICCVCLAQAPPAPGGERNGLEREGPNFDDPPANGETPDDDEEPGTPEGGAGDTPIGGPAEERPNLNGVDLEGIDLPPELEDVAPDVAAELLKIWPKQPPPPDGVFSMAFREAELEDFLQAMADNTGYIFIAPPELSGKVTITTQVDVTAETAFKILEAWLSVKSFAMTRDDESQFIRIEEAKRTRTRGGDVGIGLDPDDIGTGEEYTTQVIQLESISSEAALDLIQPMIDKDTGVVSASGDLNAIVITDTAANVSRVASILSFLEKEVDQTEVHEVKVHRLRRADAQSVATMLTNLFEQPDLSPQAIQQAIQRAGGDAGSMALPGAGLIGVRGRVKVVADERTNSVIVLAAKDKLDLIDEILQKMDDVSPPEILYRVFELEHADPIEVVTALNDLWEQPRGVVSGRSPFSSFLSRAQFRYGEAFYGLKENVAIADIRTGKVVVTATADNMPAFEKMVDALDRPKPLQELTHVYRLKNARAEDVADALNDAFRGARRGGGFLGFLFGGSGANSGTALEQLRDVNATAEPITNQIIVTAQPRAFGLVKDMIDKLDKRAPQVFVRVIIADVTLSKEEAFGVEWNWFVPNTGGRIGTTGDVNWEASDPIASRDGLRWGVISQAIQGFISAIRERGDVEIVSTPHIMLMDNYWGTIAIGERIPVLRSISESASGRVTQEIGYEEANIRLSVRPQVGEGGLITLRMFQRIDDVELGVGRPDTPQGQPTIIQRQAYSQVSVRDGQTIIIGGIIQNATRKTKDGVPILRDIPLIGGLFEHEHEEHQRTELMVFLTPYIVLNEEDAARHTRDEVDQMLKPIDGLDPQPRTNTRWDDEVSPLDAAAPTAAMPAIIRPRTGAIGAVETAGVGRAPQDRVLVGPSQRTGWRLEE